ncbi:MAG: hypothetical protein HC886_16510 [Leptolyngbyaceae cyanobacterium SM1_1_3]|nr:hypothetical protein [Leptolyngbyaceae cyanobacterium SM1_1_3]NJN04579.1 hypothetical protein [Leptolyngbyaceae cyanobacterium RM1_1_2]NJO11421.1 hypothetical protein [Leptolyngbyaceae cyanobacterium SL_1_1]
MTNEPSKFELAVVAYRESCDRDDLIFQQPVEEHSKVIDNVIYLRTGSVGYVARYDVRRRRMLV